MKKDGKGGERHGTPAERLLAAQAKKNNALPEYRPFNFNAAAASFHSGGPTASLGRAAILPPPPPPAQGFPTASMGPPGSVVPPPPPPGFNAYQASGQPGLPPPPPPPSTPMHYAGPPPPSQMYDGPPPQFMTGSNGAPLGTRQG